MSENMLPIGGTAVADRPAHAQPLVEDSLAGDNRKKLLYVLVGVGVLVLGIVAFFLLKSGGSSTPVASGLVPHGTAHGTAVSGGHPAAPAAAAPVTLPRQVKAPEGRDPFKALVAASSAVPSSAPSAAGSAPSSAPSTGTAGSTAASGSTGSNTVSSAPITHPVWVRLLSVTGTTATFDVGYSNGKTLTVKKFANIKAPKSGSRTVFGTSFALLGISSGKVALQYGDGSPFVMDMAHNYMVVS
jgi:hypothetical protein